MEEDLDISSVMDELDECFSNETDTLENRENIMKQTLKEREKEEYEKRKDTKLWNPILSTEKKCYITSSYGDMVSMFGKDIAEKCFKCSNKTYDKELIKEIWRVRKKKKNTNKITTNKNKYKTPFIGVEKAMLTDIDVLPLHANKTMLYFFLRANEWSYASDYDTFKIFGEFFIKKRLLAACISIGELKNLFQVSERTIIRWVEELEKDGALIKFTQYDKVKKEYKPTIYILGYLDNEGYYIYLLGNGLQVRDTINELLISK